MEESYSRAIAWAQKHRNARHLECLYVGLENHRQWMRERAG